jgi:hypothetical protein
MIPYASLRALCFVRLAEAHKHEYHCIVKPIKPLLLLLCLLFSWRAPAVPSEAFLLDRVVASVGSEVILLSEVNFESRLALIQRGGALGRLTSIDDGLRKSALQGLIIQTLLYAETKRLRAFDAAGVEALKALRVSFMDTMGESLPEALAEFEVSDAEFTEYLRRKLYADRLLAERVSGPPNEEEILTFYQSHSELFAGKSLREAREEVVALTQERVTKERLLRYLDELKNRFAVRVLPISKT